MEERPMVSICGSYLNLFVLVTNDWEGCVNDPKVLLIYIYILRFVTFVVFGGCYFLFGSAIYNFFVLRGIKWMLTLCFDSF